MSTKSSSGPSTPTSGRPLTREKKVPHLSLDISSPSSPKSSPRLLTDRSSHGGSLPSSPSSSRIHALSKSASEIISKKPATSSSTSSSSIPKSPSISSKLSSKVNSLSNGTKSTSTPNLIASPKSRLVKSSASVPTLSPSPSSSSLKSSPSDMSLSSKLGKSTPKKKEKDADGEKKKSTKREHADTTTEKKPKKQKKDKETTANTEEGSGAEDTGKKKVKKKKTKDKKKKKKKVKKKSTTTDDSDLPRRSWNNSTNSNSHNVRTWELVDRIRSLRGEKTPTKLTGKLSDATMKRMQRELLIANFHLFPMGPQNSEREMELQKALKKLKKEKRLMHKQLEKIKEELELAQTQPSSSTDSETESVPATPNYTTDDEPRMPFTRVISESKLYELEQHRIELELALEMALAAEMNDDEELQMLMGRSRSNSNVSRVSVSSSVTSGSEDTQSVTSDDVNIDNELNDLPTLTISIPVPETPPPSVPPTPTSEPPPPPPPSSPSTPSKIELLVIPKVEDEPPPPPKIQPPTSPVAPPSSPGGGPPPPPPPPPPPGSPSGGPGGPPPPPPMPGKGPPPPPLPGKKSPNTRPSVKPSVQLKTFQWNKIPNSKLTNTFWNKPDEKPPGSPVVSIEDKYKEIEELFCAVPVNVAARPSTPSTGKQFVNLLDHKRANNVAIVLSRIKMSYADIKNAILNCDSDLLPPESIISLLKLAPTVEEITLLKNHVHEKDQLGKAEQFYLEICTVPRLTTKLQALAFKTRYEMRVPEILPEIQSLDQACVQVKTSQRFAMLLEVVLVLGNFMNGGTHRGDVSGFKLDTLLKMGDTKSSDRKMTLLHYFMQLLESRYPDALQWWVEMGAVDTARKVALTNLAADMKDLRDGINLVKEEIDNTPDVAPNLIFKKSMSEFYTTAGPQYEALEKFFKSVQKKFCDLVEFYGEDPNTASPEDFFTMLFKFHLLADEAIVFNRKQKEALEKAAQKEMKLKEKEQQKKIIKKPEKVELENMKFGALRRRRSKLNLKEHLDNAGSNDSSSDAKKGNISPSSSSTSLPTIAEKKSSSPTSSSTNLLTPTYVPHGGRSPSPTRTSSGNLPNLLSPNMLLSPSSPGLIKDRSPSKGNITPSNSTNQTQIPTSPPKNVEIL